MSKMYPLADIDTTLTGVITFNNVIFSNYYRIWCVRVIHLQFVLHL